MKHVIFSGLFLCALTITSSAQFSAGIKAGGNFTNVIGADKSEGHKFKPGFHVGALAQYDISESLSLQTEIVYSRKGFKEQNKLTSTTGVGTLSVTITTETNVAYNYAYIDVPLLLNIHFGQMGSYVGLGPQVSFLAGAKWDGNAITTTTPAATGTVVPTSTSVETPVTGNDKTGYSKVDFGAVIGTGSKFDSGIEYCIRAGYGFTNVVNPTTAVNYTNEVWHNLVFTVSLGYMFHFSPGRGDRYGHKYNSRPKRRRH